ncbi:MAG TPA: TIGR03118 family protein [Phycisphaerales bacterium]|nr:TIGR03118 family protein [Phycisphaerales bacterium]
MRYFASAAHLRRSIAALAVAATAASSVQAQFVTHNLVGSTDGVGDFTDGNLLNPWGLAFNPEGYAWVANQGTSTSTLYDGFGAGQMLIVDIAGVPGRKLPGTPTGVVFNNSDQFLVSDGGESIGPGRFLFATEQGTIAAWNPTVPTPEPSTQSFTTFDDSAAGSRFTGMAIDNTTKGGRLFLANQGLGRVDVLDGGFDHVTTPGTFSDAMVRGDFAPFNVHTIDTDVFVTWAAPITSNTARGGESGDGFVSVFDTDGNLKLRLFGEGHFNAPWGIAKAPDSFGVFAGDILVGNYGDGKINAFDPTTGDWVGTLTDADGDDVVIPGLRALSFGNGMFGQREDSLFFTAGPDDGAGGVYGELRLVPSPGSIALAGLSGLVAIRRRR